MRKAAGRVAEQQDSRSAQPSVSTCSIPIPATYMAAADAAAVNKSNSAALIATTADRTETQLLDIFLCQPW
jgi:hypothetical protein